MFGLNISWRKITCPDDGNWEELFQNLVSFCPQASSALQEMIRKPLDAVKIHDYLKNTVEKGADQAAAKIYVKAGRAFITPRYIDREHVIPLINAIDDVIDFIESAGYKISILSLVCGSSLCAGQFSPYAKNLVGILLDSTAALEMGMSHFVSSARRHESNLSEVRQYIHGREEAADELWREVEHMRCEFLKDRGELPVTASDLLTLEWVEVCRNIEESIDSVKKAVDKMMAITLETV